MPCKSSGFLSWQLMIVVTGGMLYHVNEYKAYKCLQIQFLAKDN